MRYWFLIALMLVSACSTAPTSPQQYRLVSIDTPKGTKLGCNDFYAVYYVYINVIRAMELDSVLNRAETETVIRGIVATLKRGNAAQIIVPGYRGEVDLRATVRTDFKLTKDAYPNLFIASNYHPQLRRAVDGERRSEAYATYFVMKDDKLIKHQFINSPKSQAELNRMTVNNRADYYLLDGDADNDAEGKALLERALEGTDDAMTAFMLHLTLSEYHLLAGDLAQAQAQIAAAEAIMQGHTEEETRQRMKRTFGYGRDVAHYYAALRR